MTTKEFNAMYLDNKDEVFSYINWKVGNIHNAEDLTADVFNKAYRLIYTDKIEHRFNPAKSNIKTWLRTIANCAIIDNSRTDINKRFQCVSDFVNSEGDETFQFVASKTANADFELENNILKERLSSAFSNLKPKYKRIAEIYFLQEKNYNEIVEILNVPIGTVKGMINRVREMLQGDLKGLYFVRQPKVMAQAED